MEQYKYAQRKLDEVFDRLDYDRRTGENRAQRRERERTERRAAKKARRGKVPA